jgi:serine/threonine-protein kinase
MYELLTSRRWFDGADNFETMMRVRSLPIPRPSLANPRVSPQLDRIVMTALERDPARRWQSAAAMRDAIREVIAQPENFIEPRHVTDWVRWAFTKTPGEEVSGVSLLHDMVNPDGERTVATPPPIMDEPPDEVPLSLAGKIWLAGAAAIAFLLAASLVYKVLG